MFEVQSMCKRVVILKKGKIVVDGEPYKLIRKFRTNNLEQLFISLS